MAAEQVAAVEGQPRQLAPVQEPLRDSPAHAAVRQQHSTVKKSGRFSTTGQWHSVAMQ